MKYLAHYVYLSPEDTYDSNKERPTVQSSVMVTDSIEEAINFIHENFDGWEFFDREFKKDIIEWDNEGSNEYFGDDSSAGQSFRITAINGTTKSEI